MPHTDWGWLITETELRSWIIDENDDLLAVNKPGLVVCHPCKHGPWSSLIGACRELTGLPVLHMPSRLDRETSGVVVLAKNHSTGSLLQCAIQNRRVAKSYTSILCGELREAVVVDQPIGRATGSAVYLKQAVRADGQPARTHFTPLETRAGYTLARIQPESGRLHQIRVHAAWLGHPVAADKLYGPDETLFLDFIRDGFTGRLPEMLPMHRQALHASELVFHLLGGPLRFEAPLAPDIAGFWRGLPPD
ncbi:MAG: RNA pseudouridine synthase [Acidobacteria bacterium]|nr:RNA pseudouridine synthase [Acidobacteriota bacterium]